MDKNSGDEAFDDRSLEQLEPIIAPLLDKLDALPENDPTALTTWPDHERTLILAWLLDHEVMNGGYFQYFVNTEGAYVPETLLALARLEMLNAHEQLLRASELFKANRDEFVRYWANPTGYDPDRSSMEALDDSFDGEALERKLVEFAKEHGLTSS